jgi:hypothetical protein
VIILSLFVKVLLWSWGFQVIAAGLLLLLHRPSASRDQRAGHHSRQVVAGR